MILVNKKGEPMTVIQWFGPQGAKKKKRPAEVVVPEADVLKQVLTLLNMHRILAWRNIKGATKTAPSRGGRGRFIRYGGLDGAADVFAILPPDGQFLAIECKRSHGGVVSDDQVAFGGKVEAAGGVWLVVSDVRQLQEWLKARKDGR